MVSFSAAGDAGVVVRSAGCKWCGVRAFQTHRGLRARQVA